MPLKLLRSGTGPKLTLAPAKRGTVAVEPCQIRGDLEGWCAKLEVFENRASRTGRKIPLNILILPSKSAKPLPDPVFGIAGGPGQSAAEAFPGAPYIEKIRDQREIVLVDQRGTGGSNLLNCAFTNNDDPQTFFTELFPSERVRACRAELEKKADLTQYTTTIAMDDLNEVRQALGYSSINLIGGSYGTRAALEYLRRHGDHVRSAVIKGVAPPGFKLPLVFARTIQDSMQHLFADCAADVKCKAAYPNLQGEFEDILKRLDKGPAEFTLPPPLVAKEQKVRIGRGIFVDYLRPILYSPDAARALPAALHQAYMGDFVGYGALAFSTQKQIGDAVARGMLMSVLCAEDEPISASEEKRETAGSYLGDFRVRSHERACAEWPRGKMPADYWEPVRSDKSVLIISGDEDPATPSRMGNEVAKTLPNSMHVAIRYGTHLTQSACIDDLMAAFVANGSAKGLDAACAAKIKRPAFLILPN